MVWAYATATAADQGAHLGFRLGGCPAAGTVLVEDAIAGKPVLTGNFTGRRWDLAIGTDLRSGLYRAVFEPGEQPWNTAYFAVRRAGPDKAPALLSVPFATWQAYNRAGEPGQSLYWTEQPSRASSVSFDRPGGGPPPEQWELPMMRWLRESDWAVDYCSNIDLHLDPGILDGYRLLVIAGHDEYWTWQMREAVESFTRRGGNVAIFGGNTCWWQMRLDDGGRTMTCYRDAIADPVVRAGHPELATVEWSSAPVCRPENAMTGLSFRLGAGCWERMAAMAEEAYVARFADHWVFDGTGLADGDTFGFGCLGYETDAAHLDQAGASYYPTGKDGSPASLTVLATADLRHWAAYGQGGAATMGIFTSGAGTVFNAGTVCWGAALDDPVVARITGNVLGRLTAARHTWPAWTAAGTRAPVRALASAGAMLYAVVGGAGGTWFLGTRQACGQNLPWRRLGAADGIGALASPRDAVPGAPTALYGARRDGVVVRRPAEPEPAPWTVLGRCPPGARGLAVAGNEFYLLGSCGRVWSLAQGELGSGAWALAEEASGLVALAALNGRLVGVDETGGLLSRLPVAGAAWERLGDAAGCLVLAGHAGALYGAGPGRPLLRRG